MSQIPNDSTQCHSVSALMIPTQDYGRGEALEKLRSLENFINVTEI